MKRLFPVLACCCLLPALLSGAYKADFFCLNLESGFSFSTYSSLNKGIKGFNSTFVDTFGPSAAGKELQEFNFDVPVLLKALLSPFSGKVGSRIALSFTTGYIPTFSWNTIRLLDTTLEFDYTVGVFPFEVGAEYTFAQFRFLGGKLSLSGGVGFGLYRGKFALGFSDSGGTSGIDATTYPREYGGFGAGALLTCNAVWKLSSMFSVVGSLSYRYANINTLKSHVTRSDGTTVDETLYTGPDGFASGVEAPAGMSSARINLSGLSVRFGVQFAFGTVKFTDIPEGLYR